MKEGLPTTGVSVDDSAKCPPEDTLIDPQHLTAPKYRKYDHAAITDAYIAVKNEKIPVHKAAKLFSVPNQTLRDRVSGKVSLDCVASGPAPILSTNEEAKLVQYLKVAAKLGYSYNRQKVVDIATDYCVHLEKREPDKPLTLNWFRNFRRRWPELHVLKPKSLEGQRAKSSSSSVLSSYFNGLKEVFQKYDLQDKPDLIFSLDEKEVTQTQTSHYHPHSVASGKSKITTILGCGNASGIAIPPFLVFAGKRMMPGLLEGATPGVSSMMTESGWSNLDVFRHYLKEHFIKFVPTREPNQFLLLLLDGHKSHVAVDMIDWAEDNKIVLFILPADISHVVQPLDIACFGPFQRMYNSECLKLLQVRTNSSGITRYDVCGIASRVYAKALCAENLHDAFCKTGIYPFNPCAISDESVEPAEVYQNNEKNKLVVVESNNVFSVEHESNVIEVAGVNDADVVKCEPEVEQGHVTELKTAKAKIPTKPVRKIFSKIVSGKAVKRANVGQKIITRQSCRNGSTQHKGMSKSSKCHKRKGTESEYKSTSKGKKSKLTNCVKPRYPQAEPSHVNLDLSSTNSESESPTVEEDKCCVCELFTPKEVENSVSSGFTNWVKCDSVNCTHWVHLTFCTDVAVVTEGSAFFCPHCDDFV